MDQETERIKWFDSSPDQGDPDCLCSWCGLVISADELPPFRMFRRDQEARFHNQCLMEAIEQGELIIKKKDDE
jgi:hypothetical protein